MLAGGLDATYRQALATPHTSYVLVEVLDGAGAVLPIPADRVGDNGGLQFLGGSVSATLGNRVTRQLSLILDETLYPFDIDDLLAPYGNRIRVWRGIQFADGSAYRWVVFTGRIHDVDLGPDGQFELLGMDRANEVLDASFLRPENSNAGATVHAEFVRLVSEGVRDASFGISDQVPLLVPQLTWESDRAGALDEMATAAGCVWFALANGDFVLRRYPFAVDAPSLVTLSEGPGGLIQGSASRDRVSAHNSITVTGERADGSPPVYALAQDLNPASPTYVLGNFGLRHKTINLQTPATQGAAQTAADEALRMSISINDAWSWSQPVDAALELGDVVTLNARGKSGIIQVVSGFTIPLDLSPMVVVGRAQVLGLLVE